jgi:hypothetical protein
MGCLDAYGSMAVQGDGSDGWNGCQPAKVFAVIYLMDRVVLIERKKIGRNDRL